MKLVIPILNPTREFFTKLIPSIHNQTLKEEILLINSGDPIPSGDYETLTIDQKDFNHANTRNLALAYEADFYLFMTQDATPADEHLVSELLRAFDDPDVVVTYARQIPYADADPIERFARETNYPVRSRVKSMADLPELGIKTFFSSDSCALSKHKLIPKKQSLFMCVMMDRGMTRIKSCVLLYSKAHSQ